MVDYVICAKLIIGVHSRMFLCTNLNTNSRVTFGFSCRQNKGRGKKRTHTHASMLKFCVASSRIFVFASLDCLIYSHKFCRTTNDTAVKWNLFHNIARHFEHMIKTQHFINLTDICSAFQALDTFNTFFLLSTCVFVLMGQ